MKKIIITAVVFIACQSIALLMLSGVNGVNFSSTTDEVDMEIYEFEHEGHEYMIFEEEGKTVSVIHSPDCALCAKDSIN